MEKRKSCIIITAYIEGRIKEIVNIDDYDCVICADNGYFWALQEEIFPDLIIGDFDSLKDASLLPGSGSSTSKKTDTEIMRLPVEKDYTDTHVCIQEAVNRGFKHICIVGGMGGRLDHTLANLQSIAWAADSFSGLEIYMLDKKNKITVLKNSEITLHGKPGETFSLISFSESCTGVNVENAKWSLENAVLTNHFPLGTSNELLEAPCRISVEKGELLVIRSMD
ncbi:MAG: thiamine diphosphokinase [Anaerovoracaceae bacterium]